MISETEWLQLKAKEQYGLWINLNKRLETVEKKLSNHLMIRESCPHDSF